MSETNYDHVRTAGQEELAKLVHDQNPEVLRALLENPALDEGNVCLLLSRKDLPGDLIEELAQRKHFLKSYQVKKALVLHPHTPRLVSLRLLRDLYLMDLVQLTLTPGALAELKRNAEDQLIARLAQLPLGQKITLARRGPGRAAAELLATGHPQIVDIALGNPNLTEAQILRTLSKEKLPARVVDSVSHHPKWSHIYNIRVALVRQPGTTLSTILAYLPELTVNDLRQLVEPGVVPENLRRYLQAEIQRRMRANKA